MIHSERSEEQRDNTVRAFRGGSIWVLVCTELMGRGIDFKGVNLVINYDFPPTAVSVLQLGPRNISHCLCRQVSYIHRIGRTGRAGRAGEAVTFFTEQDRAVLRTIAQVGVTMVVTRNGCDVIRDRNEPSRIFHNHR